MKRGAFTLIELIFVIVLIGLLSKYGIDLLFQSYKSYIYTKTNNALQSKTEMAVDTIASRLMYRIKESTIARSASTYEPIASSTLDENATVLEWIGYDVDGQRGDGTTTNPLWSGIIDIDNSGASALHSPQTDLDKLKTHIEAITDGNLSLDNSAIFFIGSNIDVQAGFGWGGTALANQNGSIHPIKKGADNQKFESSLTGVNFSGVDVYEYYQLAYSAYAIAHKDENLYLYHNYRPWLGQSYTSGSKTLLMSGVNTFRFIGVGDIIKIQVCAKTKLIEEYSLCKEKTVF